MQTILRSIFVCITGFILSFFIFITFFKYGNRADIMVGYAMFMFYVILLVYSLVVESALFLLYQKNHLNAFVTTYLMAFIFLIFYLLATPSQDSDFLIIIITAVNFFLLQTIGYYYQKRREIFK